MDRVQDDEPQPVRWITAVAVAAGWTTALTAASVALFFLEETYVTTNRAFNAVMVATTLAFVGLPVMVGRRHRSLRVGLTVALCAVLGWAISASWGTWAYSSIGGGP